MKKISFGFDKNGKLQVATEGFSGNTCMKEMKNIATQLKNIGIEIDPEFIKSQTVSLSEAKKLMEK